jgi:hypothetical protein
MRYLIFFFIFHSLKSLSLGQDFEQKALDYFDKVIKPDFIDDYFRGITKKNDLTFYFNNKTTDRLTLIDIGAARKPKEANYHNRKIIISEIGKCGSIKQSFTNVLELKKPISFLYKAKYINKPYYVHISKIMLWKRKWRGEFNVYVDRVLKCGEFNIVNITIYPTVSNGQYNFNIFFDKHGNIIDWYYVYWVH